MFKKLLQPLRPILPYILLLLAFAVIYIWRQSGVGWIPSISDHLSNFALSGILLLILIGPRNFENIKARNTVFAISLLLALANIIVESINVDITSSVFNRADFVDALCGIIAVLLVVMVYWIRVSKRRSKA